MRKPRTYVAVLFLAACAATATTALSGLARAEDTNQSAVIDKPGALRLTATAPSSCCVGMRGNIDGMTGPAGEISLADITYFMAWAFQDGPPPPCLDEADVNADGGINICDLYYLVEYLFNGGPAPAAC